MLQWITKREKELGITPDEAITALMMPESIREGDDIRTLVG